MKLEQAIKVIESLAAVAILPQSSRADHVAIQQAIEVIKASLKVEEVKDEKVA